MAKCPICDSTTNDEPRLGMDFSAYDCPRCGRWAIKCDESGLTIALHHYIEQFPDKVARRSRLSQILRRQQPKIAKSRWAEFSPIDLQDWHLEESRPSPSKQLDDLILWLGNNQLSPAESAVRNILEISAWIGISISSYARPESSGLDWLLAQQSVVYVESLQALQGFASLRLSMLGWDRFETLTRRTTTTRNVLMAMQFGDVELDAVVENCFKPAVRSTGFELRTIANNQPAGLIDDQLRVALRNSRFVVADLTHRNNGAYWEAGFAEGLGRPVIYTCRKFEWGEKASHFDTSHLVTIIWDPIDLADARKRLAATIRATFPDEATMSD